MQLTKKLIRCLVLIGFYLEDFHTSSYLLHETCCHCLYGCNFILPSLHNVYNAVRIDVTIVNNRILLKLAESDFFHPVPFVFIFSFKLSTTYTQSTFHATFLLVLTYATSPLVLYFLSSKQFSYNVAIFCYPDR